MEKNETEEQIEHNRHEEIDRIKEWQCATHAHDEERPKPETPDWSHGTTEAMDVDNQKAFDNIVEDSALMLMSEDDDATPGYWLGKLGFLSSCLGYAVFLDNIWRYLCYRNDNSFSLIPYIIMLFFIGIPLFFGQISSKIFTCVWKFYQEILLGMLISSSLDYGLQYPHCVVVYLNVCIVE